MSKKLMNMRMEAEVLERYQRHARTRGETFTEWALQAMKVRFLIEINPLKNDK